MEFEKYNQEIVEYVNLIEMRMKNYDEWLTKAEGFEDKEMIHIYKLRLSTFQCSLNVLKQCIPELEKIVDSIPLMKKDTGTTCR